MIKKSFIKLINYKRSNQLDQCICNGDEIQESLLKELLQLAKNTIYGIKYDFRSIRNYETFNQNVPISEYESLKSYIFRMMTGEKDVLWAGETKWFAKSSGTTNDKSKFIPISRESLEECHYKGLRDVQILYYQNYGDSSVLSGKTLTLGGSHRLNKDQNHNIHNGDLSAILLENLPFWTDFYRTPDTKIALTENFSEKIDRIAQVSVKEDVRSFAGVPSWYLVLFKHILECTGKSNLLEIWPNLELFIHGGICFDPYVQQYKNIIPSDQMRYMETYNASEGFFAVQNDPYRSDLLLMLDLGIFYEFIPLSEIDKDSSKIIPIWEIELNVNYAMVITTNGGLWRYLIGDTIKFTSRNPYKIVISGRTKHFINAFGEEIIIDNANKALTYACEGTHAEINEYTAAPVYMDHENSKGKHQWLIEFEKEPDNIDKFVYLLDSELQRQNSDYEAKRFNNTTLNLPILTIAPKGLFIDWLGRKKKLGGQNKVPRLANNRQYIDELLALIK